MGELTKVKRSLIIPNHTVATYTTQWQYDSWNRLLSMTYPDGETVSYNYDTGGQLYSITGKKDGVEYPYVDNIKYDEFEQRTYLKYGNGAETNYAYKPDNRLLNTLKVKSAGTEMLNISYSYDALQNITKIINDGNASNNIGGKMSHNYHYDKLNRLDSAYGVFDGLNGRKANYTLALSYDNMHNIIHKKQDIVQSGLKFDGILNAGYELNYTIDAENSQQIRNIADATYRQSGAATAAYQTGLQSGDELKHKTEDYGYDANGNLLFVNKGIKTSDSTMQVTHTRKLLWDEDNRLLAVSDNRFVSSYFYDASGERTVKLSGTSQGVFVNGSLNKASTNMDKFTAYINPYLVVNNGGYYSKHIYAGSQRIVSKLGSSEIFHSSPTFSSLPPAKLNLLTATVKARYDSLGVEYHGMVQGSNGLETSAAGKINTAQLYFYHPDHLGSSSLITDNNGTMVQHLQYMPFGEVFIDERKSTWSTPFKFSAKEQDEETGLHYFGARYYDSRTGTWISVDPLAEKYPNISSYVYCADNPIKYIDPNGEDIKIGGQNGSSVIFKTDLIDVSVDASSLGVDFGGTYTLQGEQILGAALDIVGIVDPTGVADGLNAALSAENGEWLDAGISTIGLIPYAGDLAKAGKIKKDINIIEGSIDAIKEAKSAKQLLKEGRAGKQARLKELADDPKLGKADKGWLKQEKNQVDRGKRSNLRNPPGKDLAHPRGKEAAKGYSYKHAKLNNRADHRIQHRYDNNGRANKARK